MSKIKRGRNKGEKMLETKRGRDTDNSDVEGAPLFYSESGAKHKRPRLSSSTSGDRNSIDSCISSSTESDESSCDEETPKIGFGNANNSNLIQPSGEIGSGCSTVSYKLMSSMGYEEGKGLGKYGQGIVEPIKSSNQRGRRGLGFSIEGFEALENSVWDKSKDYTIVKEEIYWLENTSPIRHEYDILLTWAKEGPKKKILNDEDKFCHPSVLSSVISSKTVFDSLPQAELIKARSRSNPFESLSKLFFQNRAALKMANLDAVCDFMFTSPKDMKGHSSIIPGEVFYFADVCAAPGGFSEYVLWRRKEMHDGFCLAKGFGFTLEDNDFKLDDFLAAPPQFFEPYYGSHGDGDVYKPKNITSFREFVLANTFGRGVHFMMADGGFSVKGEETIQEILSKRLYLCQFLVALGIVRVGGHFVCKIFDIFTPFSVGLVYLMYISFQEISIHKPNSSRPANSERYLICKHKLEGDEVYKYLFEMNLRLEATFSNNRSTEDIVELVPLEFLRQDHEFFDYICNSNNELGSRQIVGLQKIRAFCQDSHLTEDRQTDLRRDSLAFWRLPDVCRTDPMSRAVKDRSNDLIKNDMRFMSSTPEALNLQMLKNKICSGYNYRFVFIAAPKHETRRDKAFYLGCGGNNVYRWNGVDSCSWENFDTRIELPADTLIYGEFVDEIKEYPPDVVAKGGKMPKRVTTFHIIDGFVLNGYDIRERHITERSELIAKFAIGINKPSRDLAPIRCKKVYKCEHLSIVIKSLISQRRLHGKLLRVYCEYDGRGREISSYFVPSGIMLLKSSRDPWVMDASKSAGKKYWFNTKTKESRFDTPQSAISPFGLSYQQGGYWWWEPGAQIFPEEVGSRNQVQNESIPYLKV